MCLVNDYNIGATEVSTYTNVPRATVIRKARQARSRAAHATILSPETESKLAKQFARLTSYVSLPLKFALKFAYSFSMENERENIPQSWKDKETVGLDWWYGFRKRNDVTWSCRGANVTCQTCFKKMNSTPEDFFAISGEKVGFLCSSCFQGRFVGPELDDCFTNTAAQLHHGAKSKMPTTKNFGNSEAN